MEEAENFMSFLREKFNENELKMTQFVFLTELLDYNMLTERTKSGDKFIERPTNILELSYLKFCAKKFDDSENMLEKIFLFFIGYSLKEYKNTWKLNLNNIDIDLNAKCSYCHVNTSVCPFKLIAYIKKTLEDNKIDSKAFFNNLFYNKPNNYVIDQYKINNVVDELEYNLKQIGDTSIDIIGAQMLLLTDSIKIEKEENGILHYVSLDFDVKNNSLFNNLNEFYSQSIGVNRTLDLINVNFTRTSSYIFKNSPIEIAAYIRYMCKKNNVDEKEIIEKILIRRNFRESEFRIAYYNQYVKFVDELECNQNEKDEIISIITYIRNYYYNENLPYVHFNIALYTKNTYISDKVISILNRYTRTFNYITNKGTLWVDTEMLVKRSKDSVDMIMQVDRIYNENDIVIFENIDKIKNLNEFRVDAFFTAIEKFNKRNRKSITFFVENEDSLIDVSSKHPLILNEIINKEIYFENYDVKKIKEKIIKRLEEINKIDDEFSNSLEEYIKQTYNPNAMDEYRYIDKVSYSIVFDKFKKLDVKDTFEKEDVPKLEDVREVDEILNDIDNLVGLVDVKESIKELIKYVEYSKKIQKENIANLNMIFKGNSGTGKTTIAILIAELFYKLGFIKENKLIVVTSKDLIGTHLGETAPKTQMAIDSALDGVLFIDEAYTIMSSKGTANYPAECIATLCKSMELYKDRLIVIFAGYTKEMNEFLNANQGLMSRIGYELEFPDFSQDELIQIFKNEVDKNGFMLENGVEERIGKIVAKNKVGRNFGNARFVTNLFDRLVVTHASNCDDDSKLKLLTNKDIDIYEETKKDKNRTVDDILKDLNSLIGLAKVKDTINGFVSVIELNKKMSRMSDFNMHMIFKGNAGTGKTTVARLLAEVYYNLGYVKRNKLVEVQSQDLIGEFLGQTGPKTQAIIESALDGVLFIDEAYAIMEHNGSNASYSAECVATLLKAMEDYQGRLIIIFAGYTEEMRKFRDLNPGLKSRIGYEIDFEDYTLEELLEIFDKKVADKGFKTDKLAREKVKQILLDAKEVENFGNGRFVENTVQKIIVEHAKNTRKIDNMDRLITFTEDDISEIKAEESKKRIGF